MPKVITREYDNSSTGLRITNSFAVVVPGFCGTPKAGYDPEEVFDDNGVYECSSQADFINYVGQVNAVVDADSGEYATLYTEGNGEGYLFTPSLVNVSYNSVLNQVMYSTSANDTLTLRGALYTYRETTDTTKAKNKVIAGSKCYQLTPVVSIKDIDFSYSYTKLTNADKYSVGTAYYYLEDNAYIPATDVTSANFSTKVEAGLYVVNETETKATATYMVIKFSTVTETLLTGENPTYFATIGNQIAYELLGLGYTVLYKRIKAEDINAYIATQTAEYANSDAQLVAYLSNAEFWEPLKDKSLYNYRYITTGGVYDAAVANAVIKVAEFNNLTTLEDAQVYGDANGRGEVIALTDIDETNVLQAQGQRAILVEMGKAASNISSSTYAAIFAPRVIYALSDAETAPYGGNSTFPASFEYLASAAMAFQKYAEWYAVAGYKTGYSKYTIKGTTLKFGSIAQNTLAPRVLNSYTTKAINLVINDHGNFVLWANRTAYKLNNTGLLFSHFLNVRQLCTTLKKKIESACKQFTFDPNSDLLWINFYNMVDTTLKAMKGDQGVRNYKITKVTSTKKAVMMANVHIVPVEAAEDFDLSIYLEDSVDGTAATVTEE